MSLESDISDILAYYWLEGHPYCGVWLTEIFRLLRMRGEAQLTLHTIRDTIQKMRNRDEVSTREVQQDLIVYPKRALLEPRDPLGVEDVGVYTKQLRLGGSQIELRFFNRKALDRYRKDPRYTVVEYGACGFISIKDKYYLDKTTPEEEKVSIRNFGTAYRKDGTPVVTVMLIYLGELSLSHQYHWFSNRIPEECYVDSDFVKTNFEGQFTERVSPFFTFLQELEEVNKLCDLFNEPHLFRNSYKDEPPENFRWITKPTRADFDALVLDTHKLIFENMNRKFFKGKVDLRKKISIRGGKKRFQDKGPLELLTEYLNKLSWFPDPALKLKVISTFKKIRKMRKGPAHLISPNTFEPSYFDQQKRFIYEAYDAIYTLRIILMNHPSVKKYDPPRWLRDGRIA